LAQGKGRKEVVKNNRCCVIPGILFKKSKIMLAPNPTFIPSGFDLAPPYGKIGRENHLKSKGTII
jgi:hypothetical protein